MPGGVDADDVPPACSTGCSTAWCSAAEHTARPAQRRSTDDRGVVGLGAAPGEDHLSRRDADHVGDLVARLVDRLAGSRANRCEPLGLAKRSVKNGSIASTAAGRIGVVAAWSR